MRVYIDDYSIEKLQQIKTVCSFGAVNMNCNATLTLSVRVAPCKRQRHGKIGVSFILHHYISSAPQSKNAVSTNIKHIDNVKFLVKPLPF